MFSYITLALATASSVSGLVLPRAKYAPPTGYNPALLEPYDVYHQRYVDIGCTGKQGSAFFDQCCHPLLKTQTLDVLPAQCIPGASSSAASATSAAPSASASSGSDDGWCYEGDEGCECEDDDDEDDTSSGSPTGEVFKDGHATFFYQNGVAGACGTVHQDSDYVAALPAAFYGDFGQQSSNCGRKIRVTRVSTGKFVDVVVADGCPSCERATDVDLSKDAFLQIATEAEGRVDIFYQFIQ